jgi:HCOMODA/2-hydroxy-3-carboxy-muconic semialdehyde decarboxylase
MSFNSPITFLNEKEANNAMNTNEGQIKRAWDLWCQQEEGLI